MKENDASKNRMLSLVEVEKKVFEDAQRKVGMSTGRTIHDMESYTRRILKKRGVVVRE